MNNSLANIILPLTHSFLDYPDRSSHAIIVYFTGCEHDCPECHNIQLKESREDKDKNIYSLNPSNLLFELISAREKFRTDKVVLSGGDPLSSVNINFTKELLELNDHALEFCIFTGHSVDYVKAHEIKNFEYLKTGRYFAALKQHSIKTNDYYTLASQNQQLFDRNFNLLTNETGMYIF